MHGSDRVAEMYDAAIKKKIPPEELLKEFEFWQKNVEELNASRRIKTPGSSSKDYQKTLEQYKGVIDRRIKKKGTVAQRRKKRGG